MHILGITFDVRFAHQELFADSYQGIDDSLLYIALL
jgi:hypothetical protein